MRHLVLAVCVIALASSCAGGASTETGEILTVYTSVTQDTVDAVVDGFETSFPHTTVEVFRAPSGELTARVAAELRENSLQADVLWLTDPLNMQQYEREGLLAEWQPAEVDAIPEDFRSESFFGTRILNLVIVAGDSLPDKPSDWPDLTTFEGTVAFPDPTFAGSAFAALGFFALDPGYGIEFYGELRSNGAVQVRSPGDVVNGVAEGIYAAGMTLDRLARAAMDDGSPIELVWPLSGSIALYSPIAVVDDGATSAAKGFVDYVLGVEAQAAIAETGWEPIRDDVEWPFEGDQQTIDWELAFDRQDQLITEYAEIFEG